MENKMLQNYKAMRLVNCQVTGIMLKVYASSAGISLRQYYRLLARALQTQLNRKVTPSTVKRYTTRGVAQNLTYSDLSVAIEQAYQAYINNPKRTNQEILVAKKAHNELYPVINSTLDGMYSSMKNLEEFEPCLKDTYRMQMTAELFFSKKYFEDGKPLSKEEADWLVESVRQYPYQKLLKLKKKNQ